MIEVVILPSGVYRRMIQHARDMAPQEAGGFLGGRSDLVTELLPLPNLAGDRRFLAAPRAQFAAERRLIRLGLTLVAVYHSHPGGGPELSALDHAVAAAWAVPHVVVAVDRPHGRADEIRAYRVSPTTVEIPVWVV